MQGTQSQTVANIPSWELECLVIAKTLILSDSSLAYTSHFQNGNEFAPRRPCSPLMRMPQRRMLPFYHAHPDLDLPCAEAPLLLCSCGSAKNNTSVKPRDVVCVRVPALFDHALEQRRQTDQDFRPAIVMQWQPCNANLCYNGRSSSNTHAQSEISHFTDNILEQAQWKAHPRCRP